MPMCSDTYTWEYPMRETMVGIHVTCMPDASYIRYIQGQEYIIYNILLIGVTLSFGSQKVTPQSTDTYTLVHSLNRSYSASESSERLHQPRMSMN